MIMKSTTGLRFLRPCLQTELPASSRAAYLRFFSTSRCLAGGNRVRRNLQGNDRELSMGFSGTHTRTRAPTNDPNVAERKAELLKANALTWPRIHSDNHAMTTLEYYNKYHAMGGGEINTEEHVLLRGRVKGFRVASSKLVFVDLVQEGINIQGVCNLARVGAFDSGNLKAQFKQFYHLIRRGDIISFYGNPYVTNRGELSINAIEIPQILSPSLASLPKTLEDRETRIRNRHVDMLVNNDVADILRARSHIIQTIRNFLLDDNFLEVQTPLIADKAGGAIAKPFTTVATEFSDKQLALRIAPEIWLKRLVIGGMDRIFEIGPAFRNEGLDATHNPEFTTCEFYKAFTDLEQLMGMTEAMFSRIATRVAELKTFPLRDLPTAEMDMFHAPFARIAFIPAIESALGEALPNLSTADAESNLTALFTKHALPLPLSPTLPRLLDKLASIYIEPHCSSPTFITHHPACMSPLSKSFTCPTTTQHISARAELFIGSREIANMYEEENSPIEQRRKFEEQLAWKDEENSAGVDESYLEALEWGLPPTGGWGAGMERVVMVFTGRERISDVLPFGSLRNVVNLGKAGTVEAKREKEEEGVEEK